MLLLTGTQKCKKGTKNEEEKFTDYDIKVVYVQEANPARDVIQTGETHQMLPTHVTIHVQRTRHPYDSTRLPCAASPSKCSKVDSEANERQQTLFVYATQRQQGLRAVNR